MLSYIWGESAIHGLDTRVKLLWLVSLLVIAFSSRSPVWAAVMLSTVLLATFLSSISPLSGISPPLMLFLLLVPLLAGTLASSFLNGLVGAAILFSAVSLSVLFILTTKRNDIVSALFFFRLPKETAFSLSLSLAFLPEFERRFSQVRIAQASRGNSGRNPLPLAIPFMHSALRKAKNLSLSLEARAFDPERVAVPNSLAMKRTDWLALACLALFILARLAL